MSSPGVGYPRWSILFTVAEAMLLYARRGHLGIHEAVYRRHEKYPRFQFLNSEVE